MGGEKTSKGWSRKTTGRFSVGAVGHASVSCIWSLGIVIYSLTACRLIRQPGRYSYTNAAEHYTAGFKNEHQHVICKEAQQGCDPALHYQQFPPAGPSTAASPTIPAGLLVLLVAPCGEPPAGNLGKAVKSQNPPGRRALLGVFGVASHQWRARWPCRASMNQ